MRKIIIALKWFAAIIILTVIGGILCGLIPNAKIGSSLSVLVGFVSGYACTFFMIMELHKDE